MLAGLLLSPGGANAAPPGSPVGGSGAVTVTPVAGTVLARFGPGVRASFDPSGQYLRQAFGLSEAAAGADAGSRALVFAAKHADLLAQGAGFMLLDVKSPTLRGPNGVVRRDIVRLGHTLRGIPVEGRVTTVTLNGEGRVISFATDAMGHGTPNATTPTLDAAGASRVVETAYRVRALPQNATLVLMPSVGRGASSRLAWKVPTVAIALVAHFWVWIDAVDGRVLKHGPMGPDQGLLTIPAHSAETR